MSAAVIVVIALGTVAIGLVLVVLLALIQRVRVLNDSLRRYQEETTPVLQRLQAESEQAQVRAQVIQEKVPTFDPGARLRKSS